MKPVSKSECKAGPDRWRMRSGTYKKYGLATFTKNQMKRARRRFLKIIGRHEHE